MKKKLLKILICFVFLCACAPTKQIKLQQHATLSFFYVETCSQCQAFKKKAIPLLEKTFQDQLTIYQYDLDDPSTQDVYDQVIDALVDFDEEFYGNGPFIVLEDYFALLGYNAGDEEYLVQDIQKATSNEELGYELEGFRFLYQ